MSFSLKELLNQRHSCRAFLPTPVPREDIETLLNAARRAPSGANLQPGMFHVYTGHPLRQLTEELSRYSETHPAEPLQYDYFPQPMPQFLKQRQREAGYALYQALGIEKRDIAGRRRQFSANYRFFDAPVGIVVTINNDMGAGCYMDLGMSLMSLFLAATELGYGSCGIGALAYYGQYVHQYLELPNHQQVVCGIALGRPKSDAPVNGFRTQREPLDNFARLHGFDNPQEEQA